MKNESDLGYPCIATSIEGKNDIVLMKSEDEVIDVTNEVFDFMTIDGERVIEHNAWNKRFKITIEEV